MLSALAAVTNVGSPKKLPASLGFDRGVAFDPELHRFRETVDLGVDAEDSPPLDLNDRLPVAIAHRAFLESGGGTWLDDHPLVFTAVRAHIGFVEALRAVECDSQSIAHQSQRLGEQHRLLGG